MLKPQHYVLADLSATILLQDALKITALNVIAMEPFHSIQRALPKANGPAPNVVQITVQLMEKKKYPVSKYS